MVELHSWITVRETYEVCESEGNYNEVIKNINKAIQRLKYIQVSVKVLNGEYYIEFSLYTNHLSADVKECLEFFSEVGKIARGSYGLLYLHNDEDAMYSNEFQIWRLTRGKVRKYDDTILSPFIPIIEDFDKELNSDERKRIGE